MINVRAKNQDMYQGTYSENGVLQTPSGGNPTTDSLGSCRTTEKGP